MKKNIFAIIGYSCAGKSTLIKEVVNNSNETILRYSDIHWRAIKNSGYKLGIDWIKEKGFDEYENGALDVFTKELEKDKSNTIIIDGIFSYKCFKFLKDKKDINLVSILLETSFDKRLKRMIEREGCNENIAQERLKSVDWLKHNAGLFKIMEEANYIINGENTKEIITRTSFKYNS